MVKEWLGKAPKPQQAEPVLSSIAPVAMSMPPRREGKDLLKSYATSPWLHSTVGRVAEQVARIPYQLFVARTKGAAKAYRMVKAQVASPDIRRKIIKQMVRSGDMHEITEHPLLTLLASGNDTMIGWLAGELVTIWLDLIGEAMLWKERDALRVPVKLWPMNPLWFTNIASPGNPFFELHLNGKRIRIPREDIIYIARPNPLEPYKRGVGTGMSINDEVATDDYLTDHIKAAFYNNLRPDTIIAGDNLSNGDVIRLETDWRNRFRRIYNRFNPYFLNKKIEVHRLNGNNKEAETLKIKQFMRDTIIQVYGVPPEIFGIIENSNRATIQGAEYIMSRYVVDPRKDFQRANMQQQLIPDFDDRLILDYVNPIDTDWDFVLKVATQAPYSRNLDEWRELQELPSLDGVAGKLYPVEFKYRFLSQHDEEPEPADPSGQDEEPPEPDPEPKPEPDADPADDTDPEDTAKARQYDPLYRPEARRKGLTDAGIEDVIMSIRFEDFTEQLMPVLTSAVAEFGKEFLERSGVSVTFREDDKVLTEFLDTRAGDLIKGISTTTRKRVRAALVKGRAEGLTGYALSKRVEEVFQIARGARARTIARTEVGTAQAVSHQAAINQAEIPFKEWLPSLDPPRSRSDHDAMAGQIVRANELFTSGSGNKAPYPCGFSAGDENYNCRCSVLAAFSNKSAHTPELKAAIWKAQDDLRQSYERRARQAARRGFDIQEQAALDALAKQGA